MSDKSSVIKAALHELKAIGLLCAFHTMQDFDRRLNNKNKIIKYNIII